MAAEIRPRRATLRDAPAVSELVNSAFEQYIPLIGRKPLPMTADHADLIANHEVWVLEEGNEIVAVLEMIAHENDLYIDTVAVKSSRQSRGIGRGLLAFAETRAKTLGLPALTLFTNERYHQLLAMYSRLGYVETHRVGVQGTDAVYMRKPLEVEG